MIVSNSLTSPDGQQRVLNRIVQRTLRYVLHVVLEEELVL